MKRSISLFIFLALLIIGPPVASGAELLDRIVAVVDDDVITQSELDRQLAPIYKAYKEQYKGAEFFTQMSKARMQVLNQMVEDKVVLAEAKRREIPVTDTEVQNKINEFKKRFRSTEDFQRFLDSQGITMTKLKSRYRDMIVIKKVQSYAVSSQVVVSPLEAKRYYEENPEKFKKPEAFWIRAITIRKKPGEKPKANRELPSKEKLTKLRNKILKGEGDFEEIARQNSEDTHAAEGGDMGPVLKDQLAPHLETAIFKLEPGKMTPVLETEIGFHVFKLERKEPEQKKSFEEAKKHIEAFLYQEKSRKRFAEWIKKLREDAYISIR